jgi:hypothetical protein
MLSFSYSFETWACCFAPSNQSALQWLTQCCSGRMFIVIKKNCKIIFEVFVLVEAIRKLAVSSSGSDSGGAG